MKKTYRQLLEEAKAKEDAEKAEKAHAQQS